MRKSDFYLISVAAGVIGLVFLMIHYPASTAEFHRMKLKHGKDLVKELHITDLCLFTEARYTRHITQADMHSPFQDHPTSMEHFPSGSIVKPPSPARSIHHEVD